MEQELDLTKSFDKKEAVIMQNIDEDEIFPPEKNSNIICTRKIEGNKKTKKGLIKMRSLDFAKESPIHGKSLRHARSFSSHFLINIDEMMSDVHSEKDTLISKTLSGKLGIFSYDRSSISSSNISDDMTLENSRKGKKILRHQNIILIATIIAARIGFVLQDDVVFPNLTVKETLIYAALLRLPNTLSKEQKKERAIRVINELGLERCQDTIIGGEFVRGVSGGERKRVCIGNEILLNPSLLFLDEPTSGQDSTTALRIVQMLHNIARAGTTVVTTIHQPSSRLFSRFDKLILLGQGNALYFGKASEAMLYFSLIGCSPRIAMNPAEFLIDLANGNITDKSIPSDLDNKFLPGPSPADVHEYFVGAYEVANIEKIKLLNHRSIEEDPKEQSWPNSRDSGATWCQQFSVLFTRGLKERCHEYFSSLRITQVIASAIIVGLLWWHSDTSSPKRVSDQATIFTFPQERVMLVKERSVNMYKLSAYFIARITTDLLLDLVLPVTFLVIVYFMVGLKLTFPAFSLTLLTILLSIIAAQGLGLAIGAGFMDVKKATTFASVILMTFMLSGGFFVQEVPAFMSWVRNISINYHTYRLLLKIQYNSLTSSNHGKEIYGEISS
ncbi:hypothetical protein K7X08_002504 [Anisodus acutangulus]|uniref:ABC transporter domain-containing protein n=1 Tax=Anisodus acutangulus TaxID=402998 RepID=A0A9Q1LTM8_9SOLA|nr:hypothetical protein K7X08_002504 [Anisodus acutangulus]